MDITKTRAAMLAAYEIDVKYDVDDLHSETLRTDELHAKYLAYYVAAREQRRLVGEKVKGIRRALFDYYRGFLNTKPLELKKLDRGPCEYAPNPKDVEFYVDSDPLGIKASNEITEIEEWVTDCEMILQQVASRGHKIRTAIRFLEVRAGMT